MIPFRIVQYLIDNRVPFRRSWHARAVSAQELAASLHVSGYRVAKSVIVEADGSKYIAVLPAAEMLDASRMAQAVQATHVRLVPEEVFASYFPDCEVGAEPPFGGLYGLPVVLDERLASGAWVLFRAGSHEETLEIQGIEFFNLEKPITAPIGKPFAQYRSETESLIYQDYQI